MSSESPNRQFVLPDVSNTFGEWLNGFNTNFNKIDAYPIPFDCGSGVGTGSNLSVSPTWYWIKFQSGLLLQYTTISVGTQYPCTQKWSTTYASDKINMGFPTSFKNDDICLLSQVTADKNPDMQFVLQYKNDSRFQGQFICAVDDSQNVNSKSLSMIALGRWQ